MTDMRRLPAALALGLLSTTAVAQTAYLLHQFPGDAVAETIAVEAVDGLWLYQSDMIMPAPVATGEADAGMLNSLHYSAGLLWPESTLPYVLDPALPAQTRQRFLDAAAHWNEQTGIEIVPRGSEWAYLRVVPAASEGLCASTVGYSAGAPTMQLGGRCSAGSVIHEIGHALGFKHEHSRPDRDQYITLRPENFAAGKEDNFAKLSGNGYRPLGEYDLHSIMHYATRSLSNGNGPSFSVNPGVPHDPQRVGQREGLSDGDIAAALALYGVDLSATFEADRIQAGSQPRTLRLRLRHNGPSHEPAASLRIEHAGLAALSLAGGDTWQWQCTPSTQSPLRCERGPGYNTGDDATLIFSLTPLHDSEPAWLRASLSGRRGEIDPSDNTARLSRSRAPRLDGGPAPPGALHYAPQRAMSYGGFALHNPDAVALDYSVRVDGSPWPAATVAAQSGGEYLLNATAEPPPLLCPARAPCPRGPIEMTIEVTAAPDASSGLGPVTRAWTVTVAREQAPLWEALRRRDARIVVARYWDLAEIRSAVQSGDLNVRRRVGSTEQALAAPADEDTVAQWQRDPDIRIYARCSGCGDPFQEIKQYDDPTANAPPIGEGSGGEATDNGGQGTASGGESSGGVPPGGAPPAGGQRPAPGSSAPAPSGSGAGGGGAASPWTALLLALAARRRRPRTR